MSDIFSEIGIVVAVATVLALLVRLIKQPPLVGYILTGIILGPLGAHFLGNTELFEALRQIGTALLLFLVGLEMDWTKARHQIETISWLSLFQLVISLTIGFALAAFFHQSAWTGIYLGLALTFSSTVIVVKLLSEARDMNSLHGRLAIGTLIMQDLIAIVTLTLIGGIAEQSSLSIGGELALLIVKIASIIAIIWLVTTYIFPILFAKIAKSSELLFLSSLAWCFVLAISITYYDMPLEIGAFLAGVSLASLPYTLDIVSRLRTLRDFFVILLFVSLGSTLVIPTHAYVNLTIILIILTVIAKPIFTTIALMFKGYKSRTAFLAGLTQGQFSEFALILAALGLKYGHISGELVSSITFAAIISILVSTIIFSHRVWLYHRLKRLFHLWRWRGKKMPIEPENPYRDHIVIFGYHRMGYHILKKLRDLKHQVVVVDFNPEIITRLREQNVDCVYGDIQDDDILEAVNAKAAKMIISTVPHREETLFLVESLRKLRAEAIVIVTAHHIDDALQYYKEGASYVILPHLLGGEHVADLITQYEHHELRNILKHRAEEIKLLRTRNHALYYD